MKTAKSLLFLSSLGPLFYLLWGVFTDNLGANPIENMLHTTGWWALFFLILTLVITPLRKISGWNKLIRFRRMLGLFGFFYATLHFGVYLGLDRLLEWGEIVKDLSKRPYITVGFTAWLLLIPLAITSNKGWIRRLGKRWQKLHRLIYISALGGVLHFWWLVKADIFEPLLFGLAWAVLMLARVWFKRKKKAA